MWIFISLCLAAISYVGNGATAIVITGDDRTNMLKAHNDARDAISDCSARGAGTISPAANTLPHLAWDGTLANLAKEKAEGCWYGHGSLGRYNGRTPGENLACRSVSPGIPNPSGAFTIATNQWIGAELGRYKTGPYGQNNCKVGSWTTETPKCAHYTQAIWEETTRIGCAYVTVAECGGTIDNSNGCELMTVCLYDPAGNTIGQTPYETSSSCGGGTTSNEFINFGYEEDEDADGDGDGGYGHQAAVIAVVVVLVVLFCVLGAAGFWFYRRRSLRGKVEFNDDIGIDEEEEEEEDGQGKETEVAEVEMNEVEIELNAETRE